MSAAPIDETSRSAGGEPAGRGRRTVGPAGGGDGVVDLAGGDDDLDTTPGDEGVDAPGDGGVGPAGSDDGADPADGDDAVVRALLTAVGGSTADGVPAVQVVRGAPDEVELAALVAGIVAHRAANGRSADAGRQPTSAWGDRARQLGAIPAPGPAAWLWSARR
ncbi:acyl-CoA carboxylase subunit epsilon [Georgenia sp. TF02-10]|uniref:acyl-CoA carboxylase subunit epsilon n=1 Tax=Georgenia sp. TF02-10 TaxID=2917725 RepID=UPI001FA70381|nr:acyl-CoA carboxylase subunit epsilon [Georgenia sp. TF02-10]UNX55696.1 acyl-CoA carboxylase subunit epsilon [Georgenia sp. TF02-10]